MSDFFSQFTTNELGVFGEKHAESVLRLLGFTAVKVPQGTDLLIEGKLRVEVKTIRQGKDKTYSATLRKAKHQNLDVSDLLLLQIVESDIIHSFLVPVREIPQVKRIKITSSPAVYRGKFARFYEHWKMIDFMLDSKKSLT